MSDIETFAGNFVCFELQAPPGQEEEAVRNSLAENPRNGVITTGRLPGDESSESAGVWIAGEGEPSKLALNSGKLWARGRTLKIRFLAGSEGLKRKVRRYAETWQLFANIRFDWIESGPADIRIDFAQGGGSWSYVGTICAAISEPKPTMNFGWLTDRSAEQEIQRVVLHEFGHALGCVHEHQSPLCSIDWNTERVYADMANPPNNWSRDQTDRNIIRHLSASEVTARLFDPDSIMLYQYPGTWMKNFGREGTKMNTALSKEDKAWIQFCYPAYPTDVGVFNTLEKRPSVEVGDEVDSNDIAFEPPYSLPPKLAMGLTWVDMDHQTDLRITAESDQVTNESFRVSIRSGKDINLFTAGCSWLEVADTESDLLVGEYQLGDLSGSTPLSGDIKTRFRNDIRFPTSFDAIPQVLVWFQGLNLAKDKAWKLNTYASKVSRFGFTLCLDIGEHTALYGARMTWVAFPQDKPTIFGGSFGTPVVSPREQLPNTNTGYVNFPEGQINSTPQLLMAISGFDFAHTHNLRLRVSSSAVSTAGMSWHLDSWMDSVMYGASGVFLAISRANTEY
ncbi:hypothetical protein PENSUB_3650 [Penicillium subrubescens]|uniref:Peptidase metallopeptidase domain-containing protein n=1 Tax=Penicillium subrubescens TaxID=1316194 RepID=A0A1Q5UEC6_9EURO|nr:hypothetical protein PENSUB_3650 [Penicillium subrubescens]